MSQGSSVLFSLNQLMSIESERIREEDERRAREKAAAREAEEAAARRALEEQQAAIRAEEERRARAEAARREEAARHEAQRLAAITAARIEAERRAHIAELERRQEHERQLAQIEGDDAKRRLKKMLTIGLVSGLIAIGGGVGAYFGHIKPEADRRYAAYLAEVETQRAAAEDAKAKLEAESERRADLERQIREEQDASRRLALQQQLKDLSRPRPAAPRAPMVAKPPPKPQGPCDMNDPINPCLR